MVRMVRLVLGVQAAERKKALLLQKVRYRCAGCGWQRSDDHRGAEGAAIAPGRAAVHA
jgi:hypothetical protein